METLTETLIQPLAEQLLSRQLSLVTAESCTGGGIAAALTELAGASQWFERGFVTYSNQAKAELLNIELASIEHYGAVSHETARAMAEGALQHSHSQLSVSVTGIAGPDGGSTSKPVGTVFFGFASNDLFKTQTVHHLFSGDRQQIRQQSIQTALSALLHLLTLQPED